MTVKQSAKRGRPPQTAAEADRVRARIVAAAGEVFAEHGSRSTSVALIIDRAGIARPTFYRYFANALEPLNQLLDESDAALVNGVMKAVEEAGEGFDLGIRVIDAYLTWTQDRGPMLRPMFAELHDPASPVSIHRERAVAMLRTVVVERLTSVGRPRPADLDLDVLLQACEYVGFRLAEHGQPDAEAMQAGRLTMIRMALATLGRLDDLQAALLAPEVFDVTA